MTCRSSPDRALLAAAILLVAAVAIVGLFAREVSRRRPLSAEHLIDQLSQAAKLYELDGNAVYPPGDPDLDQIYYLPPR